MGPGHPRGEQNEGFTRAGLGGYIHVVFRYLNYFCRYVLYDYAIMSGLKKSENVPRNDVPAETWHSQQRELAANGAAVGGGGVGQHSPDSSLQQDPRILSGNTSPSMSMVDLNTLAMGGGALPTLDAATLQQLTLQAQQMNGMNAMNIDLALLGYNALLQQTLSMGPNEVQELILLREALRKLKPSTNQSSGSNGSGQGNGPSNPLYKTELCRSWEETGTCRYGAKCQFAHSRDELRPVQRHPKYKTELCRTFSNTGTCPYGTRCRFIHHNLASGPLPPHLQQQLNGNGSSSGGPPSSTNGSASPSISLPTAYDDGKNTAITTGGGGGGGSSNSIAPADASTADVQGATTAAAAALQALALTNDDDNDDDDTSPQQQEEKEDDDDDNDDGIDKSEHADEDKIKK